MHGTCAFWGNAVIQFQKMKIENLEGFDDSFMTMNEAGGHRHSLQAG